MSTEVLDLIGLRIDMDTAFFHRLFAHNPNSEWLQGFQDAMEITNKIIDQFIKEKEKKE